MHDSKMIMETKCGYNKWSIGVDENLVVKVGYGYHPGYLTLDLHDVSIDELKKLGKMFTYVANRAEQDAKERAQ